jgi:hypothetical protein
MTITRRTEGGIYLLKYSKTTVKLGMSKSNISARLRQYRGYHRHGKDYKRLLIIYSKHARELEKLLHEEVNKHYERIGRLEIFKCSDQQHIIKLIIKKVREDRRLVHKIVEY